MHEVHADKCDCQREPEYLDGGEIDHVATPRCVYLHGQVSTSVMMDGKRKDVIALNNKQRRPPWFIVMAIKGRVPKSNVSSTEACRSKRAGMTGGRHDCDHPARADAHGYQIMIRCLLQQWPGTAGLSPLRTRPV